MNGNKHRPSTGRVRRPFLFGAIVLVATLAFVEGVCLVTGLFPPRYRRGNPTLGWGPIVPRKVTLDNCVDYSTGQRIEYARNEIGIRTDRPVAEIANDSDTIKIAVVGDSHTDLCAANHETHPGVLERQLRAFGLNATVLSYGVGRYSPLQAYLLYREKLRDLGPEVLVLNLYTGNDFNDLLRIDDRPHFVEDGDGYRVHEPVWYRLEPPGSAPWSRLRFLLRSILSETGIRNFSLRLRFLGRMANDRDESLLVVLRYLRDLQRSLEPSVGYEGAFAAQMLNQQLLFHHFVGSREESMRRAEALLKMVRRENPGLVLVLSPLPSYQLVGESPTDEAFLRTLERLPLDLASGRAEEEELYFSLRSPAAEAGWLFIDNLTALRAHRGDSRLFNDFDYHLTPAASKIIGSNEAAHIGPSLRIKTATVPGPAASAVSGE